MNEESERIERHALSAVHAAADAATRAALGLRLVEVGDGIASLAAALPPEAIVLNRTLGLGARGAIGADEIARVQALYAEAGIARYFLHVDPGSADLALERRLRRAGLTRARGWQKFVRGRFEPLPEVRRDLSTRELEAGRGEDFARIVCPAFDLGDAAREWLSRLPASGGWRVFVSYEGARAVGVGALFVSERIAWTDFGATAPEARRRGVQRANLVARVRAALEAGCLRVHTCTGEPADGDPQHSYGNILRCGFRRAYLRENWTPTPS